MEQIISRFLSDSCNDTQYGNVQFVVSFMLRDCINHSLLDGFDAVTAGSTSELYINPMLPCIGDIDYMIDNRAVVAVNASRSKRCEYVGLPPKFEDRVDVYEMMNSQFPGYVFLKKIGELNKTPNGNTYQVCQARTENLYFWYTIENHTVVEGAAIRTHGPALKYNLNKILNNEHWDLFMRPTADFVGSIHCFQWPTQAADWPIRRREFGWPNTTTIVYIISYGCDLVLVAHRQCRHDENARRRQLRLSFSKAETVLLNSWTPTQQIVYHIARFIFNRENFAAVTDVDNYAIMSKYHIKTAMMWICEQKRSTFWVQNNLVKLCSFLMKFLADCCEFGCCRSYFVQSNLFECNNKCPELRRDLLGRLRPFTDCVYLTEWLLRNYVGECIQQYPEVKRLFDDVSRPAEVRVRDALGTIIKLNSYRNAEIGLFVTKDLSTQCVNLHVSCAATITQKRRVLGNCSLILLQWFTSMIGLSLATRVDTAAVTVDRGTIDLVSSLILTFDEYSEVTTRSSSRKFMLRKAVSLMRLSVTSSSSTVSSIQLFLSHAYLRIVLASKNQRRRRETQRRRGTSYGKQSNISDATSSRANFFLAIQYYVTGQYEPAIRHCEVATGVKQLAITSSRSHLIEGQCLPKIDDDVDIALGLVVLYQFLSKMTSAESERQVDDCAALSPNLLASYLQMMSCCWNENSSNQREQGSCLDRGHADLSPVCHPRRQLSVLRMMRRYIYEARESPIADMLLCYLANVSTKRTSTNTVKATNQMSSVDFVAVELRQLLIKYSVEQLTLFRQSLSRSYSTLCKIVTTDVEAMYAFQCGAYEKCHETCELNVRSLLDEREPRGMMDVPIYGKMSLLMDGQLASIAAAATLVYRNLAETRVISVTQLTLSLYLLVECKLKLKHPLASLVGELRRITRVSSLLERRNADGEPAYSDHVSDAQMMYIKRVVPHKKVNETVCDNFLLSLLYRKVHNHVHRELQMKPIRE